MMSTTTSTRGRPGEAGVASNTGTGSCEGETRLMNALRLCVLLGAVAMACGSPAHTDTIASAPPAPAVTPPVAEVAAPPELEPRAEPDAPATGLPDLSWAALVSRLSGGLIDPERPTAAADHEAAQPEFTIVERKDISLQSTSRLVVRVVMAAADELPPYRAVREVADRVFELEGSGVDELTVFIYLPEMQTTLAAFGVAEYVSGERQRCSVQNHSLFGTKWYAHVAPPTKPKSPRVAQPKASAPARRPALKPGQQMLSPGKHIAMMHKRDMEHLTDLLLQGDSSAAQGFVTLGVATGVARMVDGNRAVHVVDGTFLSGLRKIRIPGEFRTWWVGRGAFE